MRASAITPLVSNAANGVDEMTTRNKLTMDTFLDGLFQVDGRYVDFGKSTGQLIVIMMAKGHEERAKSFLMHQMGISHCSSIEDINFFNAVYFKVSYWVHNWEDLSAIDVVDFLEKGTIYMNGECLTFSVSLKEELLQFIRNEQNIFATKLIRDNMKCGLKQATLIMRKLSMVYS